jgi:hypothetical protein
MMGATLVLLAVLASGIRAGESPWTEVARTIDVASLIGKPVTNSRWEQIARIERVLVEPTDGRAAFVVLSFLEREEMLALPWNAVEVDARGRARLTASREEIDRAPRLYGSRAGSAEPSRFADPASFDGVAERGSLLPSFRFVSGGEEMLQGTVVGRVSRAGENGEGRAWALLDIGGETLRIDLGREDGLAAAVMTGDRVQVLGRSRPGEEFEAIQVRRGASTFQVER